jgi:hypothetical protein
MMMPIPDHDQPPWPADPQREAVVLMGLRGEFPTMKITTSYYGTGRAWLGRGIDGHPWLVISDNLARFRAALRGYWPC